MSWARVTYAYLPSILLVAFGVALEWVAWALGNAAPTNCCTGYGCLVPRLNPGYFDQIAHISVELFLAGLALMAVGLLAAGLTYRYRARR